jgi:hypothetical protein
MAFVFRAERKMDHSNAETAKLSHIGPGSYLNQNISKPMKTT